MGYISGAHQLQRHTKHAQDSDKLETSLILVTRQVSHVLDNGAATVGQKAGLSLRHQDRCSSRGRRCTHAVAGTANPIKITGGPEVTVSSLYSELRTEPGKMARAKRFGLLSINSSYGL